MSTLPKEIQSEVGYHFDEINHVHYFGDKKLKGVTTILDQTIAKPALIGWAASEAANYASARISAGKEYTEDELTKIFKEAKVAHRKKKEKAADWGTIVHKAVEIWIKTKAIPTAVVAKGENYILLPEHLKAVNDFVIWASTNNIEFLQSEKGIYSEEWGVGGIVDFVCKWDGKLFVGDVKTSSGIYETYFLQTAAYAKMMIEMGMYKSFDGMVIINCKKDGDFKVEERKDIEGNIRCYEAAITLHNRLN